MGAIGNITPSNAIGTAKPPVDWFNLGLVGSMALLLLALALPRLTGELNVMGARAIVALALENRPEKQQTLSAQTYAKAAAAIDRFGPLTGDARLVANRGLLLLRQGAMEAGSAPLLWQQAGAATMQGLALNPGNTDAWARLAYLRLQMGDNPGAAQALRLSLLTAPVSPQIMPSRLRLGLALLDSLDEEQRALLSRQVRLLWVIQPSTLTWEPMDEKAQEFIVGSLNKLTQTDMDRFIRLHKDKDAIQP